MKLEPSPLNRRFGMNCIDPYEELSAGMHSLSLFNFQEPPRSQHAQEAIQPSFHLLPAGTLPLLSLLDEQGATYQVRPRQKQRSLGPPLPGKGNGPPQNQQRLPSWWKWPKPSPRQGHSRLRAAPRPARARAQRHQRRGQGAPPASAPVARG